MKFNAKQIAELVNGEISGSANVEINSLAKIEDAKEAKKASTGKKGAATESKASKK